MKRMICIFLLLAMTFSLCSCGEPQKEASTKNETLSANIPIIEESEGSEEIVIVGESEEAAPEAAPTGWNEELASDNGEVKVSIHDDAFSAVPETMPVISVRPIEVTSGMARQVARVLFGDAPLYEEGYQLSRAEIAQRIAAWEEGVTAEVINELYGEDLSDETFEQLRADRQRILDYYRNALAYAPEEVTPKECDWLFRPTEYWIEQSHDFSMEYPTYSDATPYGVWSTLREQTEVDGLIYHFWASNLTRDGFWNHGISVFLDQPDGLSYSEIYSATGHMSAAPATEEELRQAERDAEVMMEQMGQGSWRCEAKSMELLDQEGKPMGLYCIDIVGLKDRGGWTAPFRSPYDQVGGGYPENMRLVRAIDGTLLQFDLHGLLNEGTWKEEAALLSTEEAVAAAHKAMRAWTLEDRVRGVNAEDTPTALTREITAVKLGYARVATGEGTYELIPALRFFGTEAIDGLIWDDPYADAMVYELLAIDLRDGSVIDKRTNGS